MPTSAATAPQGGLEMRLKDVSTIGWFSCGPTWKSPTCAASCAGRWINGLGRSANVLPKIPRAPSSNWKQEVKQGFGFWRQILGVGAEKTVFRDQNFGVDRLIHALHNSGGNHLPVVAGSKS